MLLPEKHVPVHASVLGVGAFVLGSLDAEPRELDWLVERFLSSEFRKDQAVGAATNELLLALSMLYAIGAIDCDDDGRVLRCG